MIQGGFDERSIAEPDWRIDAPDAEWGARAAELTSEQWRIITVAMRRAGTLSEENIGQVEVYCVNYARWKLAEAMVAKLGPIVKAPKTGVPMHNPYLDVANKAAVMVNKTAADLGLPPSMRGRVTKAKNAEKTQRASDRYIKSVS